MILDYTGARPADNDDVGNGLHVVLLYPTSIIDRISRVSVLNAGIQSG